MVQLYKNTNAYAQGRIKEFCGKEGCSSVPQIKTEVSLANLYQSDAPLLQTCQWVIRQWFLSTSYWANVERRLKEILKCLQKSASHTKWLAAWIQQTTPCFRSLWICSQWQKPELLPRGLVVSLPTHSCHFPCPGTNISISVGWASVNWSG